MQNALRLNRSGKVITVEVDTLSQLETIQTLNFNRLLLDNMKPDEIKKAYKKMAVKYHPDKVSHLGEEVFKSAEDKFQKLNGAYEEIKKQRAESLKEALGGLGYDKYSQFVDPTTGGLNELGSTFLKSDLDQQEMLAKYAALGDLESMKRSGHCLL